MLMKICAKCGKKNQQGVKCSCSKDRHKIYNASRRDKERNKFYHSAVWEKLVAVVKARSNGLDELSLSQGRLEVGNTVHHIYTVEERPDLKTSIENLIYLTAANHNRVHKIYNCDETSKKILQARLYGIISGRRH